MRPSSPPRGLSAGKSTERLREQGYTVKELRLLDLKPKDLEAGGFETRVVQAADGRSIQELRQANFTCKDLVDSGSFTIRELKLGGFKAVELKAVGCTAGQLRPFNPTELRSGGFTAGECKTAGCFKVSELKLGGYAAWEMRAAGYEAYELKAVG